MKKNLFMAVAAVTLMAAECDPEMDTLFPKVTVNAITSSTTTISSLSQSFTITVEELRNNSNSLLTSRIGFALYNSNGSTEIGYSPARINTYDLQPGWGWTEFPSDVRLSEFSLSSLPANGIYRIYPVVSYDLSTPHRPYTFIKALDNSDKYITITILSNELTITSPSYGTTYSCGDWIDIFVSGYSGADWRDNLELQYWCLVNDPQQSNPNEPYTYTNKAFDRVEGTSSNPSFTFSPETPSVWAGHWVKLVARNKKNDTWSAPVYVKINAITTEEPGDGTQGNPYIIRTAAELDNVRNNLSAHYKLGNDINLTSYLASGGAGYAKWNTAGWNPIGRFTGSLNGAGYKIIGLWINRSSGIGLFSAIAGTIKNLGVEIASNGINGYMDVGGIAGVLYEDSNIFNCYVAGAVNGDSNVGGIVGYIRENINIINCYVAGNVKGTGVNIGGIAGTAFGNYSITNCYVMGSVSTSRAYSSVGVGGIMGFSYGSIMSCIALNPSINSGSYIGVGRVGSGSTLSNNWARSDMLNPLGNTSWSNKGQDKIDGADCAASPTQSWWSSAAPNGPGLKFGNNDANPWKWSSSLSRPVLYWQ